MTIDGREFQARAAAAGNARSARVRRRVAETISVDVAADRSEDGSKLLYTRLPLYLYNVAAADGPLLERSSWYDAALKGVYSTAYHSPLVLVY